jgi:hypothetical protein
MKSKTTTPAENANQIISDFELRTRSIAKFELFEFARRCGWPSLPLPSHLTTIGAGEEAWRNGAPLGIAATRRTVWNQLVTLEANTLKERT